MATLTSEEGTRNLSLPSSLFDDIDLSIKGSTSKLAPPMASSSLCVSSMSAIPFSTKAVTRLTERIDLIGIGP